MSAIQECIDWCRTSNVPHPEVGELANVQFHELLALRNLRDLRVDDEIASLQAEIAEAVELLRLMPVPPNLSDPPASTMMAMRTDTLRRIRAFLAKHTTTGGSNDAENPKSEGGKQ